MLKEQARSKAHRRRLRGPAQGARGRAASSATWPTRPRTRPPPTRPTCSSSGSRGRGQQDGVRPHAVGQVRPRGRAPLASTRAPAAPTRRTGPRCSSACTPAGPSGAGYKLEILDLSARRRGGHQERHPRHQGRVGLRLPARRGRRAPPGAHLALRRERAPPDLVRQRVRLSRHRRDREGRDRREGSRASRRCARAAPAGST